MTHWDPSRSSHGSTSHPTASRLAASREAIVVKTFDEGSKSRAFGHAMVAGVDRAPLKVTRTDSDSASLDAGNLCRFRTARWASAILRPSWATKSMVRGSHCMTMFILRVAEWKLQVNPVPALRKLSQCQVWTCGQHI